MICLECKKQFTPKKKGGLYCSRLCGGRQAGKRSAIDPVKNFWSKVEKTESCWLWKASRNHEGHGRFQVGYKNTQAHRFSWELHNGPIPKGLVIRHKCDNPPCVNPLHLELGTTAQNVGDKVQRGRQAKGESHGMRKLEVLQVGAIRMVSARYSVPSRLIARMLGMSQAAISKIICGKTWVEK